MTIVEHQVTIDRPAAEVFAFLADGSNNPRWQPPVIDTTQVDRTLAVGTRFRQRMRHPLGFKVSADYRIAIYDPGKELALQTTSGGPIRPLQRFVLTAGADGATTVRSSVEHRPEGLARAALPVLALLHPLFSWEASWIDRAGEVLCAEPPTDAATT